MLNTNDIFDYDNKIKNEEYEKIVDLSKREIGLYLKRDISFFDRKQLKKRSLELITTINNYESSYFNSERNFICSMANTAYRSNYSLNTNLEKQIFINNYVFNDVDKFLSILKRYNFGIKKIIELDERIKEAKKEAAITEDYNMSLIDFPEIKTICTHYNIDDNELIINRILEIYYLRNEKLSILEEKPKVNILIKKRDK